MRLLSIVIFVFLCTKCTPDLGQEEQDSPFFDLSDFIDGYRERTDSLVAVSKSISVDGQQEMKDLEDYPIHRDIMGFEALDLNKAALWDRYSVDTSKTIEDNFVVSYRALDEDLAVQTLSVEYEDQQVISIKVHKEHHTFLADVSTYVEWLPAQGYTIKKDEGQMFSDPTIHEIRVDLR